MWTQRHRLWLKTVTLGMAGGADHAAGPGGRDRRAGAPPRALRARDRRDPPELAVGDTGRTVALLARDRHPDRGRVVRRDRRLRAVRPGRAADELPRAGPVRVNDRHQPPARGRSRRPGPRTPAGCWSKRPGTTERHPRSARPSPTARPANQPRRSRSRGPRNADCTAPGPDSKVGPSAAPWSPSPPPANSQGSAGRSLKSNSRHAPTTVGWVGGGPGRAGTRDLHMSNPTEGHARSHRQRYPTTNTRSCGHPDPRISG